MSDNGGPDADDVDEGVLFSVTVENGRTTTVIEGDKDSVVVVQSASGERIYLPPKEFDIGAANDSAYQSPNSPYQLAYGSPYQSVQTDDLPYWPACGTMPREGMVPIRDGYRIRHPESVTDVRLLHWTRGDRPDELPSVDFVIPILRQFVSDPAAFIPLISILFSASAETSVSPSKMLW